ncbi:MAG: hypothetical protein KAV82_13790, partial [Phycisphaerae bacterium]|nr:hypothetical protein [Phycisphaerae bacterium]
MKAQVLVLAGIVAISGVVVGIGIAATQSQSYMPSVEFTTQAATNLENVAPLPQILVRTSEPHPVSAPGGRDMRLGQVLQGDARPVMPRSASSISNDFEVRVGEISPLKQDTATAAPDARDGESAGKNFEVRVGEISPLKQDAATAAPAAQDGESAGKNFKVQVGEISPLKQDAATAASAVRDGESAAKNFKVQVGEISPLKQDAATAASAVRDGESAGKNFKVQVGEISPLKQDAAAAAPTAQDGESAGKNFEVRVGEIRRLWEKDFAASPPTESAEGELDAEFTRTEGGSVQPSTSVPVRFHRVELGEPQPLDNERKKHNDENSRAYYDIGITDILTPNPLAALVSTDVTIEVTNYGDQNSPTFSVLIYVDGDYVGNFAMSMPAYSYGYATITFGGGFSAGNHCLGFYANISDPDMSDNYREECFTWTGFVDIEITSVSQPTSLNALEDTDVTVRITNIGTA